MKTSSVILAIVLVLLGTSFYFQIDGRLRKIEERLEGTEYALRDLEPIRRVVAAATLGQPILSNRYEPVQATGKPNAPEGNRDSAYAWCPATEDGGIEWLMLDYAQEVEARGVVVHANHNPGATVRVTTPTDEGGERELWSGPAVPEGADPSREFKFEAPVRLQQVRLYFDTNAVKGWNEIDAVALVEPDGKEHWATKAEASSFWTAKAETAAKEEGQEKPNLEEEGSEGER